MADHVPNVRDARQRLQKPIAQPGMLFHRLPLVGIQRAVLAERLGRDANLANVVQQRREAHGLNLFFPQLQRFSKERGIVRDFLRMPLCIRILRVDCQRERQREVVSMTATPKAYHSLLLLRRFAAHHL